MCVCVCVCVCAPHIITLRKVCVRLFALMSTFQLLHEYLHSKASKKTSNSFLPALDNVLIIIYDIMYWPLCSNACWMTTMTDWCSAREFLTVTFMKVCFFLNVYMLQFSSLQRRNTPNHSYKWLHMVTVFGLLWGIINPQVTLLGWNQFLLN